MNFNKVTTSTIKKSILDIAYSHLSSDANERARAKKCVSQLTSEEREYVLKVIKQAYDPSIKLNSPPAQLSNKLSRIKGNAPIVKDKDANLSRAGKSLMGVWRSAKNILRIRKSSDQVLKKIDQFAISQAINENKKYVNDQCFNKENNIQKDDLLTFKRELQQTSNYSKDFTFEDEYKTLGLAPGSSFTKVTKAYEKALENRAGSDEIRELDTAFQRLYFLDEAKKLIPGVPITLENAFKELEKNNYKRLNQAIEVLCNLYSEIEENKNEIYNIKNGEN